MASRYSTTTVSDASDKLLKQAFQARRENRLADARRDLVEAVEICRKAGVPAELAEALTGLGQIERDLQRNDAARQHYEEAVAIYRAQGDALVLAHTVRHVADIHRHDGSRELAERCYQEALHIYRSYERTPPLDLANAIRGLAILKDDAGEAEEARSLWEEARELYTAVKVEAGVAESNRRLARLERGQMKSGR
jgi:tetratricopeptide (TPR) repeat protein